MAKRNNEEHKIQTACVTWFDYVYTPAGYVLFAIPNGGERDARTGAMMKREGVRRGMPDLFLSVVRRNTEGRVLGGLYIETKTATGKLTKDQKEKHELLRNGGYRVEVVRSFAEFYRLVNDYILSEPLPF